MIGRNYILTLISLLPCLAHGKNIQSQWQELYQSAWQQLPYVVTQKELSQYPIELLKSNATYPNFEQINWDDLRLINRIATNCQRIKSDKSALQTTIEFENALCAHTRLNSDWFKANPLLHSAGGSFADRYLASRSKTELSLELLPFTTLSNPLHPLHSKLKLLSNAGRDALLNGYRAWLENDTLWLAGETGWKAAPVSIWQPIADKTKLTLNGDSCALTYSNLCLSEKQPSPMLLKMLLLLLGGISISVVARLSFLKHKQRREKRFILQLLTHELRTPITSLGLTIDMFRHNFDNLDDNSQDVFWRLVSDYQRLSQLTENSKVYLSASKTKGLLHQSASFADWLSHYCEKNQVTYSLDADQQLNLPYYWLAICLENLIKNAKQHGKGEVVVNAIISTNLIIEVSDHGDFPSRWQRLFKPNNHQSENMGIGLDIVAHLIKMMNGKLTILRNPTRCILELPYEHNSAD